MATKLSPVDSRSGDGLRSHGGRLPQQRHGLCGARRFGRALVDTLGTSPFPTGEQRAPQRLRNAAQQSDADTRPTHTSPVGRVVQGQFHANDPDGDSLTYSVAMNPAHGSVVISGDDFTYTLDQSLAQTGATDSFQVAVSDAGRGFHIHGLAGLINLLSFGIVGSSGHTRQSAPYRSVFQGYPLTPHPIQSVPSALKTSPLKGFSAYPPG